MWSYKKVFYGKKEGLNLKTIKQFLAKGYYLIPYTLFEGYYKAVYKVGDHDSIYAKIEKPFPDAIIAQKPKGRFAMHFSGGLDSALLAKLYDSEDVDYIHLKGPESEKARVLAATLKGKLHEIELTPELFIKTADEIVPRLSEPYTFEDNIYVYVAGLKAKELGHNLIVCGDGGDETFGGWTVNMHGEDAGESIGVWKTIDPDMLLGLDSFQPLMHTALADWSKTTLSPDQVTPDKQFLRDYLKELGLPEVITEQKKIGWAGSLGMRDNETVINHMETVITESDYRWIREFTFPSKPRTRFLFRQYQLVKWLEANYKEKLDKAEVLEITERIREMNAQDEKQARHDGSREFFRQLFPPLLLKAGHKAIHNLFL